MTTYDDAIGNFAQVFVNACAGQARTVAAGGAQAAALEVRHDGHRLTVEEIAARIEALHGKRQAA